MWRTLTIGILTLGRVSEAGAQEAAPGRFAVHVGAGWTSAEYHCSGCRVEGANGLTVLVAGTRSLGQPLTVGLEASVSRSTAEFTSARLVGALATLGIRGRTHAAVWGTAGLGWVWYTGTGPHSNGPALSARAGWDVPVGRTFALTPYAGYLTMIGHDGPRTVVGPITTPADPGGPTRVASLQLGLALTLLP